MDTGAIKWGQKGLDKDVWNVACGLLIPGLGTIGPFAPFFAQGTYGNCPNGMPATAGPDYAPGYLVWLEPAARLNCSRVWPIPLTDSTTASLVSVKPAI